MEGVEQAGVYSLECRRMTDDLMQADTMPEEVVEIGTIAIFGQVYGIG